MSKLWPLALLLLLPLLSGCFGPRGVPILMDQLVALRGQFEELDRADRGEIDRRLTSLQQQVGQAAESKDRGEREEAQRKQLLIGYCWERRGDFADAQQSYAKASGGPYGSLALSRTAQVAGYRQDQALADTQNLDLNSSQRAEAAEIAKIQQRTVTRALEAAANYAMGTKVVLREPPVASLPLTSWQTVDLRHEAYQRLDVYYRSKASYQAFAFLVRLSGGGREEPGRPKRSYPYVLAIVLLAVLAKLVTHPLTAVQFRSMRAMQAVQPELKKLQEKYKDDKQQLARAQMELFREHKVSPFSSCLPMLIQFPILIWVYYAIRYYVFQFEGVRFVYIQSLANPDVVAVGGMALPGPLLLLYGVSMYFSQKMLSQPGATPEQQQQQRLLSYFMPIFLLFVLMGLPAAFILYWFLQNILMTGHQYLMMRPQRLAAAAASASRQARAASPPPEVIQKLSQGTGRPKKKRKRK